MPFQAGGSFPASLIPSQTQTALNSNYMSFDTGAGLDFSQQYLPELYEQEVERYGNRTLNGFLRMVGAEMPMTSDQVIWSEQNRLHVAYNEVACSGARQLTVTQGGVAVFAAVKENQTILVADTATGLIVQKALVTGANGALGNGVINVVTYDTPAAGAGNFNAAIQALVAATDLSLYVYGAEWEKGSNDALNTSIEPGFTQFNNNPIIIRDTYQVSGSDASQIGWVEVATEDGTSGYLWYLKAESETRLRFEDYMEMAMVEGVVANNGGIVPALTVGTNWTAQMNGTQGLFDAILTRGNVYNGFAGAAAPGSGALGDFDAILNQLDKQGAIEENMLFLSRQTALDFDDMIGAQAGGGWAGANSASYGLFDNESEMALNFGFSGFRRGSYDFYKTDWKYLNDASTRGMSAQVDGVLIPAGTSTVYDQMLGQNIRRPFLHVRYRASETEDRRYKNWITGTVGGAYTDGLDAMTVHFLTERCLVTQAANNFVLFQTV